MTAINQNLGKYLREKTANKGMKYKNPIQTHLLNPNSRKQAINAHCFDCCGGLNVDDNKGVKSEIKHCEIVNCSLWNFRPYKNNETANTLTGVAVSNLSLKQNNHKVNTK